MLIQPTVSAAPSFVQTGIPQTAETGELVHIWVNISSDVPVREVLITWRNPETGDVQTKIMELSQGNASSGTWSYDIPSQPWKGELECRITAEDDYGFSSEFPASGYSLIEILGDEEPKTFPWNLVVIIAFLAVVLVLTELVFKPGFYRKTGREKARDLEEEERLREPENGEKEN